MISAFNTHFQFIADFHSIFDNLSSSGNSITIPFFNTTIDTSWFDNYRLTFRGYMSGFMWLCTALAMLRRLSPRITIS
jgi:hypothetical protein